MRTSDREYVRGLGYCDGFEWRPVAPGADARTIQRAAHAAFLARPPLASAPDRSARIDAYTVGFLDGAAFQLAERARKWNEGT